MIVTRGHRLDADTLRAVAARPLAYLGMIGSRRKVRMTMDALVAEGRITPAQLERVFAPIGLDIGAVTVPEIAASITAELVAARRKGLTATGRGRAMS